MKHYIGIDIGSVGTKIAVLDSAQAVVHTAYLPTHADPMNAVRSGLARLFPKVTAIEQVSGLGVTGSAKELAALILNADIAKNEISAHARAVAVYHPEVRTVIEIGGQDSKLILLENGIIHDFAMNSVCAAGTGSFLAQQANRLGISLDELSALAMRSESELNIAARCTVFAESDMIYKQQMGYAREDIIYGLCRSLARNYMNTLARGKKIVSPVCFQGGVAANLGMRRAFAELLGEEPIVPEHFLFMGAMGAALFAQQEKKDETGPRFSAEVFTGELTAEVFVCDDCHQQDGLSAIRLICLETKEQDMITLLKKIRQHPAIPMHGPEHHAMVPGIILATYRNRGGKIGKETILTGIERGSKVPGGVCGFWGSCGAAVGVGIGFSVMLDATPLTPKERQLAQSITAEVLMKVSQIRGARCCQRETVQSQILNLDKLPGDLYRL